MTGNDDATTLKPEFFKRVDDSEDEAFYASPRLVAHIDDAARDALTTYYSTALPAGGAILDLMSSYYSHLPKTTSYSAVVGLGMNDTELDQNTQLTERVIHNLNRDPRLPCATARFDACLIAVSIQYLTQPPAVLAEVARVLKQDAPCIVSYSNRCFPTKAVAAWRALDDQDHAKLVALYFKTAGSFEPAELNILNSPGNSMDPLYVVAARKKRDS